MSRNWASEFELPDGRTKVIDLMPAEYGVTGRELMGIISDEVFITINPDPHGGEIYKSGYDGARGGDIYSITDIGLRKFLVAGGVKELDYQSLKTAPRIWHSIYKGMYMLPNGENTGAPK